MTYLRRIAATIVCAWQALVSAQALPPPPVSPEPVTTFEYDAQGNLTRMVQAPGIPGFELETRFGYDRLYRLTSLTDPLQGNTRFTHDGLNRVTQVTDPRALSTRYVRNGFGQVTQVISPDTGTTTLTWDAYGDLRTRTDSRGAVATYRHDAAHRLTSLVYRSDQAELSLGWAYSQSGPEFSFGGGRLTSSRFPAGSALYRYTGQGRPAATVQRIDPAAGANPGPLLHTVGFAYTPGGRLNALTYPSGGVLRIAYTGGLASALSWVDASGAVLPLIDAIRWEPFSPEPRSWNWQMEAGPLPHERWRDLSGRVIRHRLGALWRDITYDPADRVAGYTHWQPDGTPVPALDQQFAYDANGRLARVALATTTWVLEHDASGNRRAVSIDGDVRPYATEVDSNRLSGIGNPQQVLAHDSAGTVVAADYQATYNPAGQLDTLTRAGITTTYSYDSSGRRIRKSTGTPQGTLVFVYDHLGQLLGEYDGHGRTVREYIWLGHVPVAVVVGDTVHFVHTDHLDTPRLVVDRQGHTRWRWLAEPFGSTAPEEDPSGLGALGYPLRFAGQYADPESGLFYNGQRYYDPQTARYHQSDPIGLVGGINTYSYVEGQPTGYTDPDGLQAMPLPGGPIPLLPQALPGTPENKALTEATLRALQAAHDAVTNAYDRCAQALGRAWDRMFSDGAEGANSGDKDPSTPTGSRGSPMDVPKGTNQPDTIGGRDYSGHALDQMQGRGVPPAAVEDAISNGSSKPDKTYPDTRTVHTSQDGRVVVVTDTGSGRVVTVFTK